MKKAWVENELIRDTAPGDPNEFYHPEVAKFYDTDVPDNAENGDGWVNGQLVKPESAPEPTPAPPQIPIIGPIAFQMLFSVEELVAIESAKETDPVVKIFFKLLDDPRTDIVDRNLKTVQDGLYYLETKGLIGVGRAQEILTGEVAK